MRGKSRVGLAALGFVFACVISASGISAEEGFKPIFDGKTFDGWKSPDMSFWSIEDGAMTARSTEEHPCTKNQFLVWERGELDDFELKLKYRILGSPRANSGIQIRGSINAEGHVIGYQADLDRGGQWLGAVYDEHTPRKMLARRGQKTVIDAAGKRTTTEIGDPDELIAGLDMDGWNDYHITARGHHLTIRINGKTTSEVVDREKGELDLSGVFAVQLHSGPPMSIQFKDVLLKRLPLSDGRKKVVLVAGPPSHAAGAHEHNAGCALLARCLNEDQSDRLLATVYRNGWPADSTAFDNADALVVYSDGGGKHPVASHMEEMEALHRRGIGLGTIHYAVEVVPGEVGDAFVKWIGGYYEPYYSVNPHWDAEFKKIPKHPITRGVKPYKALDEWYYNMRFREGMKGVTAILSARPPDETRTARWGHSHGGNEHVKKRMGMDEVVMWASETETGVRGFGFTGGHFHDNWGIESHRKAVLNAVLWLSGVEVPEQGVQSEVTPEDLKKNLDPKPVRKKKAKKK